MKNIQSIITCVPTPTTDVPTAVAKTTNILLEASRRLQEGGTLWVIAKDVRLPSGGMAGFHWLLATSLRGSGLWLRSEIVIASDDDYQTVFLLANAKKYTYYADAVKVPAVSDHPSGNGYKRPQQVKRDGRGGSRQWNNVGGMRLRRTVWFDENPFLIMVLAGTQAGDAILDPFGPNDSIRETVEQAGRIYTMLKRN